MLPIGNILFLFSKNNLIKTPYGTMLQYQQLK